MLYVYTVQLTLAKRTIVDIDKYCTSAKGHHCNCILRFRYRAGTYPCYSTRGTGTHPCYSTWG